MKIPKKLQKISGDQMSIAMNYVLLVDDIRTTVKKRKLSKPQKIIIERNIHIIDCAQKNIQELFRSLT